MHQESEMLKIFKIGTIKAHKTLYNENLKEFISEKDFEQLIKRNDEYSDKKSHNISTKKTEKQKVIRLKDESSILLVEFHTMINNMGLKIPLSILADFLILKAMNKL